MFYIRQKLFFLLLAGFLYHTSATAQFTGERHLAIRTNGYNEFNLLYRKQKSDYTFHRMRVGLTDFAMDLNYDDPIRTHQGVGAAYGIEWREPATNRLSLMHGPEANIFMGWGRTGSAKYRHSYVSNGLGIGYVLGAQYEIRDRFFIGVETIPGLSASYQRHLITEYLSLDLGFVSVAVLTFGRRF